MAQWMGQFSGRTHETKVQDIEVSLQKAVKALEGTSENDRKRKAKAVRRLSERLLLSRLKMLRARISVMTETMQKEELSKRVNRLKLKEQGLIEQSVEGILREFHALDGACE